MSVFQQDAGLSTVARVEEAKKRATAVRCVDQEPLIISCFVTQSEVKLRSSFGGGLERNDWMTPPRRGGRAFLLSLPSVRTVPARKEVRIQDPGRTPSLKDPSAAEV